MAQLVTLLLAAAAAQSSTCSFKPNYSDTVKQAGARKVWISLFNAIGANNMASVRMFFSQRNLASSLSQYKHLHFASFICTGNVVSETGAACASSDLFALFGQSYYRLELSPDGKVVRRFNAGCADPECTNCDYDRTQLDMHDCMSVPVTSGEHQHQFSVAFAPYKEESCVGPYVVTNSSGITALQTLTSDAVMCHHDVNCTSLLFAITLAEDPSSCQAVKLFPSSSGFSYYFTQDTPKPDSNITTYTVTYCNSSDCSTGCGQALSELSVNQCQANHLASLPGELSLLQNSNIPACERPQTSKSGWIIAACACGLVLIMVVLFGAVKLNQRRKRKAYATLN
ncbi:uncharacterized protein MONBRDRAFT_29069 [Monosiga brevicollis MX1]|uniref:Uncharacterized protein n=1 Tax=Monosiga brevicollis TaxID=81824 RepID=A9VA12_MONBE|nr:uncharacterized protein MONBRDRAFT_29069 [Monosiga brevicollis MX1]EDQ85649.1 predicted protein [Monosiga brevicollis MX1]|eukprot:XP_001749598.1 hypothetical protein [Monosiga brevicollis MX1]